MGRTLLAAVVAVAGIVVGPGAAAGEALPSSVLARVVVEPAAGYGFFSTAIVSARHTIDLSMYELKDPVIEDELVAKVRLGVRVRVLLNADYLGRRENAAAGALLSRGGVRVTWAPPEQIFHAKCLVVDGSRAYIGTGNLAAYDYASTRDFWVLDQVPGDVAAIEATFASDVAGTPHAPVTHGGLVWSPGSLAALTTLITSARHSLVVENEEMDNSGIEEALVAAMQRGVAVTVVMTTSNVYLSALTTLAARGVRVDLLTSSQVYVHAKAICADCAATGGTLFVGSENFSASSLDLNRELGVITRSPVVVRAVWSTMVADASAGTRLTG